MALLFCQQQKMEILKEKIQEAEHFCDSYYQQFPKSTLVEKKQAIREKVLPLIQVKFQINFAQCCPGLYH